MPEAQLTEPLDRTVEKGGLEEMFAALEAAVKADVEAFLRRGNVNAQDFETLLQTVHRRALATASQAVKTREDSFGAAFVAAFAAQVAALLGPRRADGQDFEALEQALRRRALGLAAQALAQYFNADDADHSDSTVACACGGKARYAGRRPKTFTTLLGPLTLERAYYHCDACRTGVCPRDRALGMHATSLSPGVLRMVGLAASDFSFAAASDLLWELAAVRVETKQVERCAEALGREVAADERAVAETVPSPAPTMYLGLDGTGVPVRPTEVEGRRGKQLDGSAKTREVKLATMWTAETRDKAGRPVRDLGSVSYNAAVESAASRDTASQPAAFAQRAYREAIRRGFDTAAQRVVIGDGAAWIWNIAAEQFPGAIQIVDIYHAKQHLCDVAKTIWNDRLAIVRSSCASTRQGGRGRLRFAG